VITSAAACLIVCLLNPGGYEISAHLQLVINVSIYVLMGKQLQHLLLILLDLVNNWYQEH
jgi:hypothetical protein